MKVTKEQFGEFIAVFKSCYPKDNMFNIPKVCEVWFRMIEDLDYRVAQLALKKWIATQAWPPKVSDIRSLCTDIMQGVDPDDWGKAWEHVNDLIRKYGYYRVEQAYKEMDEITLATVRRLGFKDLCLSENQTADRANFRDIYLEIAKRKRQDAQIPEQIRLKIEGIHIKQLETTSDSCD